MSFFYTREPGPAGQILAAEGPAPGVALSELLKGGPLPVKSALELVSYCADILTIAEEDGVVHGDIKPGYVTVDEGGAASIVGWGESRRGGRAPEERSQGLATDTYGLGVVLHAVLSSEPLGNVPRERDAHDDFIVDRLMRIDWQELSDKRWMDEVLHFLCSMLAHDPVERPVPLDVANVLGHVSNQAPGEDLASWAERSVGDDAEALRRPDIQAAEDEEDLGGPEALGSPVSATSALRLRKAASAKGEATAFWSRERIAELLADDEDEPVRERFDPSASRPPRGEEISQELPPRPDATISGMPAVLPPKPDQKPSKAPAPPTAQRGGPAPAPPPAPFGGDDVDLTAPTRRLGGSNRPSRSPSQDQRPADAPPAPPPGPSTRPPGGSAPPSRPQQPIASVGGASDSPSPAAGSAKSGGGGLKIVVGVFVGLLLLCGGGSVIGAAAWFFMKDDDPVPAPSDVQPQDQQPASMGAAGDGSDQLADTGVADPPDDAPRGDDDGDARSAGSGSSSRSSSGSSSSSGRSSGSSSRNSSGSTSSGSRRSGSSSRSSSGRSSSGSTSSGSTSSSSSSSGSTSSGSSSSGSSGGTASAGSGGGLPGRVRIVHRGDETVLECSPGGRKTFAGSITLDIDTVTTCRVSSGPMVTVVQMRHGGTVTCDSSSGSLICTGP